MAHCLQRLTLVIVYALLHSRSISASYDSFWCYCEFGWCIPESWLCDEYNDCFDGSDEADNIYSSIRLVGGAVYWEGRIELHGSVVGTVCSNGWTEQDADLLCKSLGYEGIKDHLVYTYGEGTGDIWSNISGCIEDASSPNCNPVNSSTDPTCTHSKDVGISCLPLPIRIVGKDSHEGRVEIYSFGLWSTVHDLDFSEAHLICHRLGYPSAEFSDCCGIFGTTFEMPSYEIDCTGDEQDISECGVYRTYFEVEQSGVSCARDGVRLINGEFDSEGLLEIYTESGWHKVCSPDIDIDAAKVICNQLHFDGVFNISDIFSRNSNSSTISNIICSGSESKFEECTFEIMPNKMCKNSVYLLCETSGSRFIDGYSRISGFAQTYFNNNWTYICEITEDVLQFVCLQQQSTGIGFIRSTPLDHDINECINCSINNGLLLCHYIDLSYNFIYTKCSTDTVRIHDGGHQGLLEIYKNSSWISVCQDRWNFQAAEIACRELNFLGVSESPAQPDSDVTITPGAAVLHCNGSETSLQDCQFYHNIQCSTNAVQLTCLAVGVRFEGSVVDFAGRVEIYTNNEWETVCDDFWDNADANVACNMAGYNGAIASYQTAAFGKGVGSIIANDFHCNGEETTLFDCPYTVHADGYCSHIEDAGVVCSKDVIRLSDGTASAGRVEVSINGQWGTVCDDNWDIDDASVVCRQLGFDGASAFYVNGRFGAGEGPIHLDEVQCTGEETELLHCRSIRTHDCQHSEDAGVSCLSDLGVTPVWLNSFNSIQTEGCNDYWFRSDRSCLMVILSETFYTNETDIGPCPHGSIFLTMDISLEILIEYLTIRYFHDEAPHVFLWKSESQCSFMYLDDRDFWRELRVPCNTLHVNAYVCQMNIQEQSHSCSDNQFKCLSGACILKSLVCDGNYDCADKSDEEKQCIQECFKMGDGSDYRGIHNATEDGTICLPWTSQVKGTDSIYPADFIGKGIGDHNYCRNPDGQSRPWCYSSDFYDVIDCKIPQCPPDPNRLCPSTSFKCKSGHCISYSFYCDHKVDCPDHSDETDCIFLNCSAAEFSCDGGRCLEFSMRCNGIVECIDGTDELKCAECSKDFIRCTDGTCLHSKYVCDGIEDCPNGIDERTSCRMDTCENLKMMCENRVCADQRYLCIRDYDEYAKLLGCRDRTHLHNCAAFQCPAHTFKCPSSFCIPIKSRCDGKNDCDNGEDEQYCDDYNCPGYFKCQDATNCISQDRVCNNIKDCVRGDDELFCNVTCPDGCTCSGLSFSCSGTQWGEDKGARIPRDIRYLNMSRVSSNPTGVDSVDELLFANLRIFRFLAILDISGNNIRAIRNTDFQQLVHLRTLCIQDNKITSLSGDIFKDLHNLKYFDVHGNGIKSINVKTFAGLSKLEYLDISGNNIDTVDKGVFKDLTSVKKLISDDYVFCCLLNEKDNVDCTPDADVFSSCANLMQNEVLRVFLWIFGSSALLGNMFVIVWRARNRPAVKSPSYIQSVLITNLAVADALMGVYMLIIASADVYYRDDYITNGRYWKRSFICNFAGILAFLSSEASVFTLTAISCDRFLNIAFPFHRCHLTPKTVKYEVAASWTITLILSIIPALPSSYFNNEFYGVTSVCLALPLTSERVRGWEYTAAIFIGVNMLCFILIFASYFGIFIFIKVSSAKLKQIGKMDSVNKQHIALAVRMVFIVATDFLCWVPIISMGILSLTRRVDIPAEVYAWAAVFILPINSAINPFLYTIASLKKVRKQLRSSKVISENISQTEKSTVNMVATNQNEYQRKKQDLSVVNKIEEIVNSVVVTGNSEVDDEIHEHLSKVLQLAKQVQDSKTQVKKCEQSVSIDSNYSSQADMQVKNSEQPVGVDSNHSWQTDMEMKSDCAIGVHNPVYDSDSFSD